MTAIKWSTFKELSAEFWDTEDIWLFRGHSDPRWKLDTSYKRYCNSIEIGFDINRYIELLHSFIDNASDFFEHDLHQLTTSAKMALAQHHGVPTPFLDWTESPYIAVFFALWPRIGQLNTGPFTVWAMRINQAKLKADLEHDNLDPSEPFRIMRPKIFESRRLARQLGWFTSLLVDESLDDYARRTKEQIRLQRYDISGDAWVMILRELQLMGIRAGNLFDSLDGVAADVKLKNIIANLT